MNECQLACLQACLLACLLPYLLACLLACLLVLEPPGFFRMLLELIFDVLLRNVTDAQTLPLLGLLSEPKRDKLFQYNFDINKELNMD